MSRPGVDENDDNLNFKRYHRKFLEKTEGRGNLDLEATWRFLLKNGPRIDRIPERVKNNAKAIAVRQEGNRYFAKRMLEEAAEKYNESICWAEAGSEELGIGFANRSAICYERGHYEFCLLNIMLARMNNYPDRLKPKLVAREHSCRQQIAAGRSHSAVPCPRLTMNVEVDPKIPFMAEGLRMVEIPEYGRAMVTERSFRPGDILLEEKAFMAISDSPCQYLYCGFCAEPKLYILIPCPDCASVMYCSKKCLREDKMSIHRFECGIKEQLNSLQTSIIDLGPKMFFYGLTLFGDNVDEMQRCCEAQERSGSNPMDVDYSLGYDALKIFLNLNQVRVNYKNSRFMFSAAFYHTVYMKSPAVRALIVTDAHKTFMLRCFMDYMQITLQANIFGWDCDSAPLLPIASIINHSCDPNVYAAPGLNHFKLIALKPIAKNEQIFLSYGPVWYINDDKPKNDITMGLLLFQCNCVACNPVRFKRWLATQKPLDVQAKRHLRTCSKLIQDERAPLAAIMNSVQQFIKRYAYTHPNESFCTVLQAYRFILNRALMREWDNQTRTDAMAEVDAWNQQQ